MTLVFLGTRGNIDVRSSRHRRHTATLVIHRRSRILIDCGADWLHAIRRYRLTAVVVTHAHPDHVDGLKSGVPWPVYAPEHAYGRIKNWPVRHIEPVRPRQPITIGGVAFESFPVDHSIGTPAVGYRITCGDVAIFYVPDVLDIPDCDEALAGIALYVGDGAGVNRSIVRHRDHVLIGHTSIATQLKWCARARVPRAIFTHCGTGIVAGGRAVEQRVRRMGALHGVPAEVACDGRRVTVRGR